jgi:hypothetical protein
LKLKHPESNVDFDVTPLYFLGDFDIYDREDSLGEYLNKYDPNDKKQLHSLLTKRFFKGPRVAKLAVEHRAELMKVLIQSLESDDFDFGSILTQDREPGEYFELPWDWEFERPRYFFEEVYRLAIEFWGDQLLSLGMKLPGLAELKIPKA